MFTSKVPIFIMVICLFWLRRDVKDFIAHRGGIVEFPLTSLAPSMAMICFVLALLFENHFMLLVTFLIIFDIEWFLISERRKTS